MDPKKQNLTPEMKAIYERVMNTQTKAGNVPPPPPQAVETVAPATNPSPQPPVPEVTHPAVEQASTNPLPSTPPQPLKQTDGKPFIFSGGKVASGNTDQHKDQKAATPAGGKKKVSPVIIVVGVLALITGYVVIWLKIFGFF